MNTKNPWTRDQKIGAWQVGVTLFATLLTIVAGASVVTIKINALSADISQLRVDQARIDKLETEVGRIKELSGSTAQFDQFKSSGCYNQDGTRC